MYKKKGIILVRYNITSHVCNNAAEYIKLNKNKRMGRLISL